MRCFVSYWFAHAVLLHIVVSAVRTLVNQKTSSVIRKSLSVPDMRSRPLQAPYASPMPSKLGQFGWLDGRFLIAPPTTAAQKRLGWLDGRPLAPVIPAPRQPTRAHDSPSTSHSGPTVDRKRGWLASISNWKLIFSRKSGSGRKLVSSERPPKHIREGTMETAGTKSKTSLMTPTSHTKVVPRVQLQGSTRTTRPVQNQGLGGRMNERSISQGALLRFHRQQSPWKVSSNSVVYMPAWTFPVYGPYSSAFDNDVIHPVVRVLINTIRHGETDFVAGQVVGLFGPFDDVQLAQKNRQETERIVADVLKGFASRVQGTLSKPLDGATKRAAGFLLLTWLKDAARHGHPVFPSHIVDSLAGGSTKCMEYYLAQLDKGRTGLVKEISDLIARVIIWQRHLPVEERLTLRQLSAIFVKVLVSPDYDESLIEGKFKGVFHQYARDTLLDLVQSIVQSEAITLRAVGEILTHAVPEYSE